MNQNLLYSIKNKLITNSKQRCGLYNYKSNKSFDMINFTFNTTMTKHDYFSGKETCNAEGCLWWQAGQVLERT